MRSWNAEFTFWPECGKYVSWDRMDYGKKQQLLFISDSNARSIASPGVVKTSPGFDFDLRVVSIPGGKISHAVRALTAGPSKGLYFPDKVSVVVLAMGTNDMLAWKEFGSRDLEFRVVQEMATLHNTAQKLYQHADVLVRAILPTSIKIRQGRLVSGLNRALRSWCNKNEVTFLDVDVPSGPKYWCRDGIHLANLGTRRVLSTLENQVTKHSRDQYHWGNQIKSCVFYLQGRKPTPPPMTLNHVPTADVPLANLSSHVSYAAAVRYGLCKEAEVTLPKADTEATCTSGGRSQGVRKFCAPNFKPMVQNQMATASSSCGPAQIRRSNTNKQRSRRTIGQVGQEAQKNVNAIFIWYMLAY